MALTQVSGGMLATGAAASNIPSNSLLATQLVTSAQYTGFKNRIINGGMTISQRGTTFSATGYTLDRWNLTQATSPTVTQSTDVPSGFKNSISVSGGNYLFLCQRIESNNVTDLSGQTVTVSFWAKQTSGTLSPFVAALDYATATDNFASTTNISTPNVGTLTSSWTYYTITYPSLPAGVLNGLQLRFYIANSGTTTYMVTGVQLEVGLSATSFDIRDYGRELIMCQRYYQTSSGAIFAVGTSAYVSVPYPVTMRAAPTLTLTGSTSTVTAVANGIYGYSATTTGTTGYGHTAAAEL